MLRKSLSQNLQIGGESMKKDPFQINQESLMGKIDSDLAKIRKDSTKAKQRQKKQKVKLVSSCLRLISIPASGMDQSKQNNSKQHKTTQNKTKENLKLKTIIMMFHLEGRLSHKILINEIILYLTML